jgi:transcriptional regulator with XRE-family HTH domain
MALFFDGPWFDRRLKAMDLTRADLALAAGLSPAALADIWKDQREVTPAEVDCIAALLDEAPDVIGNRCGVSTRVGGALVATDPARRIAELEERVAMLEQTVALLLDQATARTR